MTARKPAFGGAVPPAASVAQPSSRKRAANGRYLPGPGHHQRYVGAQAGNLNASRAPWRAFWRRRALRPEDRWILPLLAEYAGSLVADRGGPEAMTAGEAHMIELAQLARGCTMLILAQAATAGGIAGPRRGASVKGSGIVRRVSDPDLAAALARFMAVESGALRAIGLERRAKPVQSLTEYLSARSTAPQRDAATAAPSAPIDVEPITPKGSQR